MNENGNILRFEDGPAEGEEISLVTPPQPVRWYVQSEQMGDEEKIAWWSMEEPPEDPSVTVTEYVLVPEEEDAREKTESGETVFAYTAARNEEATVGPTMGPMPGVDAIAQALAGSSQMAERFGLGGGPQSGPQTDTPAAYFRAADIRQVLVGDNWIVIPEGAEIRDSVIAQNDEGGVEKVKIGLGPAVFFRDGEEYVSIPIPMIRSARFAPSTYGQGGIEPIEKTLVVTREEFDSDEAVRERGKGMERVDVIEPNGEITSMVFDADGEDVTNGDD